MSGKLVTEIDSGSRVTFTCTNTSPLMDTMKKIMPIEEITSSISQRARWLEREDNWCRELCTVYLYGLNDNVRKVGNVSKRGGDIVVNTLFNKQPHKYRKRPPHRHRKKFDIDNLADQAGALFSDYKSCNFCFTLRCFVRLPKKCMVDNH